MEVSYTIFLQIVKMFIMIFISYILYKKNITNDTVAGSLSNILLFVATPATLVNSFLQEYSPEKIPNLIFAFIASFLIYLVCVILAEILYKKEQCIEKFGVSFSNAGFLGIPLVTGVFGSKAVFYLAPFIGMFYVYAWTYGVWIMSGDKKEMSINKIIFNPCILALVIGVIIFALQIKLPSPIEGAISSFAGLNTPLAMIVLGIHVARGNLKEIFTNIKAYKLSFIRLIVAPAIITLLFALVPAQWNEIKLILLISEAAPIAALSPVFAQMYNQDAVYGAQTVCLSTILSIISMPLIMLLSQLLW